VTGPCLARERKMGQGKEKVGWVVGILVEELREIFKNGFLISRIKYLNEICSNSNEFYSNPISRTHINTKINATHFNLNSQIKLKGFKCSLN
jgi:hypothetical protein